MVLAAAHRDRDHDNVYDANANLTAFYHRCLMIHDQPEHRQRRWNSLFRGKALGDLLRGPYG